MKILQKYEIDEIVDILNAGGVIATPTDTIYGFSCLADNEKAVEKLCKIKNCDDQKLFIILVSNDYDLSKIVKETKHIDFIKSHTPNPLTMIVNKCNTLRLTKNFALPTIAIRIPNNSYLQSILKKVGIMISTSCNVHGNPSINDFEIIKNTFSDIDAIVYDKVTTGQSSTIVDLTGTEMKIVRQGDFKLLL